MSPVRAGAGARPGGAWWTPPTGAAPTAPRPGAAPPPTPEVYVLDADHRLVYHGAPDGDHEDPSRNAEWLRAALDAALAGEPVPNAETPARGCSVKWR